MDSLHKLQNSKRCNISHAMKRSIRPRPTSPSPASLPDNDDILAEILLHLPPHPSSLPRAGAVCKRWLRIVTDPHFRRRFRALHHRTPPLHGFFLRYGRFFPTLDAPDRLPPWHFSLDRLCREPHARYKGWCIQCVRHGLILCSKTGYFAVGEFLVVDPMTGDRSRVAIADEHNQDYLIAAAVVAIAGDHDAADRRPFILVVLFGHDHWTRMTASVYSSDSSEWSESVSTVFPPSDPIPILQPSSLVGHGLYWFLFDGEIVRFDLETQSLSIIEQPPRPTADAEHELIRLWRDSRRWIMPATKDGCFCLAMVSGIRILFWERDEAEVRGGASGWVLCRTVELDKVLPVQLNKERPSPLGIMGFDEGTNVIFIWTYRDGAFMSDIESMQFKKVSDKPCNGTVHTFSSF